MWKPSSTRRTPASSETAETSPRSPSGTCSTQRRFAPHSFCSRKGRLGAPSGPTRIPSASRGLPPLASRTSSPLWPRPALPRATRGTLRYTLQTIDTDPIRRRLLFSFARNISYNSDRGLNKYSTHAVCRASVHVGIETSQASSVTAGVDNVRNIPGFDGLLGSYHGGNG